MHMQPEQLYILFAFCQNDFGLDISLGDPCDSFQLSTLFDSDLGHRPMTQNNTIHFTNKHAHAKYINY